MKLFAAWLPLVLLAGAGGQAIPAGIYTAQPDDDLDVAAIVDLDTAVTPADAVPRYADRRLTPGAVMKVPLKKLCAPLYTAKVRNVPESEKAAVYRAYGITPHAGVCADHAIRDARGRQKKDKRGRPETESCEVDHLISLELGGSNDIRNLWPQPYWQHPGAHEKDVVENWLHRQVCAGKMPLAEAQRQIVDDWFDVYRRLPKPKPSRKK